MEKECIQSISFNELSLQQANQFHVSALFYNWLELKRVLLLKNLPNILFSFSQLENTNVAGIKLRDMIENSALDENEKGILYNEINSSPFLSYEPDGVVSFSGRISSGLTSSHYNDIPTISLLSENEWESFILKSNLECLDGDGSILSTEVQIRNIANLDDLKNSWIDSLKPDWLSSIDIFHETLNNFKRVIISESVINYLSLNKSDALWGRFYNIVFCLDSYACDFWNRDRVMWSKLNEKFNLNIRSESDSTLSKYGAQRRFHNEIKKREIFSYHFDMSKSLRGYLKEVPAEKRFFIAEITIHLDIVT